MSKPFIACKGKTACQEDDLYCRTCGRSLEEIYTTRLLIDELAQFLLSMNYSNSEEFLEYVVKKATKKFHSLESKAEQMVSASHEYH